MPPVVRLEPVTPASRPVLLDLTLPAEQQDFVATNAESLHEAEQNPACVPFAIIADGTVVGFAMYALDPADNNHWIYRLMVDHRYQGRGIGRAALEQLIRRMSALPNCPRIILGVDPRNATARALYESVGFRPTGEVIGGEDVMRLTL
jgi:diamine N-acetyltransferase